MPSHPDTDRRGLRHAAKKESIVAAAWELAREHGVAAVSLRAVAERVGLRQPSLYSYFDAKSELFDLMFAQGNEQLLQRLESLQLARDPRQALKLVSRTLMDFFTEDPVRYEIMNQRRIPGFEPAAESYALAQRVLDWLHGPLRAAGVTAADHVDLYVALMAGLAEVQLANEPGGDRWSRHVESVVDMLLREIAYQRRHRT